MLLFARILPSSLESLGIHDTSLYLLLFRSEQTTNDGGQREPEPHRGATMHSSIYCNGKQKIHGLRIPSHPTNMEITKK